MLAPAAAYLLSVSGARSHQRGMAIHQLEGVQHALEEIVTPWAAMIFHTTFLSRWAASGEGRPEA